MSVPHSGTQFTIELLKANGWHDMGLNGKANAKPTLRQAHCEKLSQTVRAVEVVKQGATLIVPLRHPYRVEESWRRRYDDMRCHNDLWCAYHHMFAYLAPLKPVWFPIDAEPVIRAIQHIKLMDAVDATLAVDWDTLVNAKMDTHLLSPGDLQPSDMIKEIRERRLFTEFYGEPER